MSFMRMAGPPVTTLPSGTFFAEPSSFFPHMSQVINPIIKPEVKIEKKKNEYNLRHSNNTPTTSQRILKHVFFT
jgi:hypothetical protein